MRTQLNALFGKWRTPKPWLLIDVDGVIIPLGHGARGSTITGYAPGRGGVLIAEDTPAILREAAKTFRLAWCTSWSDDANDYLCAHLGISPLPVVPLTMARNFRQAKGDGAQAWSRKHRAASVIWWDDEAAAKDAPGVTIIPVEPDLGLQRTHLMQAIAALGTTGAKAA